MIPFDVAERIAVGKISQPLATADKNNFVKNAGGVLAPNRDLLIRFTRLRLEWAVANAQSDYVITRLGLYLFELCGGYVKQAKDILGSGSSGGIVPSGGGGILASFRLQFTIGISPSPMNAGDTELLLEYTNIISNLLVITLGGTELPRNDATTVSYNLAWSPTQVLITFNQAVQNSQQYIITGLYYQTNSL